MEQSSPARLFATLAGGFLVVAGIVGFFYNASFDTGKALRSDDLLGVLSVNGWQNLFHITTGLLGLACAGYAARQYSLGIGLVYAIVAIWGFAETNHAHGALLDLLPVNTADNFVHLIIGLAGLGAGAATVQPGRAKPSASRRTKTETSVATPDKPKAGAKKAATSRTKSSATAKPSPAAKSSSGAKAGPAKPRTSTREKTTPSTRSKRPDA